MPNQALQDALNSLATAVQLDAAKDSKIADLEQKIADLSAAPKVVTISEIQAVMPEVLWYEARSPGSPKTGPHGTVTIVPGSPAIADFHPVNLGGPSDNVYCLRRLYNTLTPAQHTLMETATKFSISCDYMFDPLASVQAGELDYQIRKSSGVVINVGPQLLPISGGWIIRGFDYIKKVWVPLGAKAILVAGKPTHLEIDATCDDKIVQFTQVTVDGAVTPVTFSHPVSMSTTGQPYCNAAYQLDATGDAKPYKATISNFQVTFA